MKKLALAVSTLGLLTAADSHAWVGGAFDGAYAGVRAVYGWHKADLKKETATQATKEQQTNGMAGDVVVGFMTGRDKTVGVEVFGGYGQGSDKSDVTATGGTDIHGKIERKWRYGLDLLLGHKFTPEMSGYLRAGIHATVTDFKFSTMTTGADAVKHNSKHIPAAAVGLGVKYALNQDFSLDVGYTYTHDLKDQEYKVGGVKRGVAEAGHAHQAHVGVTFTF